MLKILENIYKSNSYAAIYTNQYECSKFMYGRIISVNQDHIAIYLISPDGYFDGIITKKTNDVLRVEIDGQYSNKMKKLLSLNRKTMPEYSLSTDKIPESVLLLAREAGYIVSLEILDSGCDDIVGFVEQVEGDMCAIKLVDDYGYGDGICYVKLSDITQISCGSQKENRILKLWRLNN